MRLRRSRPPVAVPSGERVLAWAEGAEGVVAGTRDALYVGDRRLAWELVEAADWDRETSVLRVSEVGTWGEQRREHRFTLEEPGLLLELVRERVTASVVLQRHVPVQGRRGLRVIARRAPRGDQPLLWLYEYDAGVDPADPEVRRLAAEALEAARADVGLP
ncbi:hypothetical protein ACT8ZV_03780 [Nocardioides sp. MAHUQ-72]|uniref:hypothetical protein n=1 Tax=unclassified Nocardioides TaxID=2615069 RepID=UPI0036104BA8